MKRISTLIIGAGQAGLAMSRCLSDRSVEHVVLERGEVAQSWAADRWDSLRLLTPNWQSRLPGHAYDGPDPDGFMSMPEITAYLRRYAAKGALPVETRTEVLSVSAEGQGYRVRTSRGDWVCSNLVLANGACTLPRIPHVAASIPREILQISPLRYRNPNSLPEGGVLVVGASASGIQIAAELRAAGREVLMAVGQHIRAPRRYRGRDIQWWMDKSGTLDQRAEDFDDPLRARAVPSLQLVGRTDTPLIDLNYLQAQGIEITGRLAAIRDGTALFSGGLANACVLSDLKMRRLLRSFDDWAAEANITGLPAPETFATTEVAKPHRLSLDLRRGEIRTIIWATGFRPDFSWLELPVLDTKRRLRHVGGCVAPGLYALGQPFLRRRKSQHIDGVGGDATELSDHLIQTQSRRAA